VQQEVHTKKGTQDRNGRISRLIAGWAQHQSLSPSAALGNRKIRNTPQSQHQAALETQAGVPMINRLTNDQQETWVPDSVLKKL
jgi:hypothetical protein